MPAFPKLVLLGLLQLPLWVSAQTPTESYPLDSASVEQPGVPKGEIIKRTFRDSKRFPGTTRDY